MAEAILDIELDPRTIRTPEDLYRFDVRLRERTVGLLRTLLKCRKEWVQVWVQDLDWLEANGYDPDREEIIFGMLDKQRDKIDHLTRDIKTVIELIRDLDRAIFDDAGSAPEQ